MKSLTQKMEGFDYFTYSCSECGSKVVTLRRFDVPIQCSHLCVDIHVQRIYKEFVINQHQHLRLEKK